MDKIFNLDYLDVFERTLERVRPKFRRPLRTELMRLNRTVAILYPQFGVRQAYFFNIFNSTQGEINSRFSRNSIQIFTKPRCRAQNVSLFFNKIPSQDPTQEASLLDILIFLLKVFTKLQISFKTTDFENI